MEEQAVKLPAFVYSQLGPVPVVLKPGLKNKAGDLLNGEWSDDDRVVSIDPGSCSATQLATLFHESIHIALTDSGLANAFNDEQQETLCCALGTYLAAACMNGYLVLKRR